MTTKEIKTEIKSFGLNIGKRKTELKDTMYVKHEFAIDESYDYVAVKGVVVTKERGMNYWNVDFSATMKFTNGVGNYEDVCKSAKMFNDYLVLKGYNTEYLNGSTLIING